MSVHGRSEGVAGLFGRPVGRLVLLLLAVVISVAAIPTAQAAPRSPGGPAARSIQATGPFFNAPCPVRPPQGVTVDCGVLVVPESRSNFNGRTVQLPVAIIRSPNPNKAADPVVFLTGGPGQGATGFAAILPQFFGPILANRDVILMDQRGTGFSTPTLDCEFRDLRTVGKLKQPFGGLQDNQRPAYIQQQADALAACGQLYRELGVDLRAYNSAENAADFEDLRRALGIGQWNLYGGSYGTRLALTILRFRPESVRSAVLDSAYPLQARPFYVTAPETYNRSLNALFAECAAEPACNAAFPDLGAQFDRMVAQLNASPAQLPIVNPQNGELVTYLPFTGVDASSIVFSLLYSTEIIPILPLLISATANGNYGPFSQLVSILLFSGGTEEDLRIGTNIGMNIAVECNEDATFARPEDFVRARDQNRRGSALANGILFNEAILDVCNAWGLSTPISPAENQAVVSDRPSLIISGALDPITPPQNAIETASTLSNSRIVTLPRGGHSPSATNPCLLNIVAAFINAPNQPVDTSCAAAPPAPFVVPQ